MVECRSILRRLAALACSIVQFRHCDAGDADIPDRMGEESFEHGGRLLLDEVDADVGVQHQLHAKGHFLV